MYREEETVATRQWPLYTAGLSPSPPFKGKAWRKMIRWVCESRKHLSLDLGQAAGSRPLLVNFGEGGGVTVRKGGEQGLLKWGDIWEEVTSPPPLHPFHLANSEVDDELRHYAKKKTLKVFYFVFKGIISLDQYFWMSYKFNQYVLFVHCTFMALTTFECLFM